MFKKIFALASISALSGLVAVGTSAGCSTTNTVTAPEDGAVDASLDVKKPIEATPDDPEDTGPATCPTTAAIDATTSEWKPPNIQPGACMNSDIMALVKAVNDNSSISYKDLKAKITSATCSACLFAPDGAKWAPFVEDSKGEFMRQNFGGCIAAVSGNEPCGKAFSQYNDCTDVACQDCADQTTFNGCTSPASKGACKAATANVQTVCGDDLSAIDTCQGLGTMYLFESAAYALCVGVSDGGTDAAADADSAL